MEWLRNMWARLAQLDTGGPDVTEQEAKELEAEKHKQRAAEERADRTLKFAHQELDKREEEIYERNLILASGGKRGTRK